MAEAILMPRLSDTMTEGVIAAWHKKVGDTVKKGDLLAEVETDKATMELESYKDGTLLHVGVDQGGKLQVNDLLAIIGKKGEDISALLKEHGGGGAAKAAGPKAEPKAEPKKEAAAQKSAAAPPAAQKEQTATAAAPALDISKMEEVILMPRLSDTMTEGVIASWHKKVGDSVKKGDVLADIETDKATMELESYKEGKLLYVGAKEGEKILVNDLLAIVGGDKVDVEKIVAAAKAGGAKGAAGEGSAGAAATTEQPAEQKHEEVPSEEAATTGANGRIKASPLAKKLAAEKGIDLNQVHGTGDNGRITKKRYRRICAAEKRSSATTGSHRTGNTEGPGWRSEL